MRVSIKTVTDFTGLIQFRGPQELGGLFWKVNMFLALAASFVSVWVGDGDQMAWALVGSLSSAWVAVFGVFLLLMKKDYRGTFFATATGKQRVMDFFVKGVDDEQKSEVSGSTRRCGGRRYGRM